LSVCESLFVLGGLAGGERVVSNGVTVAFAVTVVELLLEEGVGDDVK
jgi:hypothetical protein